MTVIQNRNQDEKKKELFLRQKQLLDTFLEHGAISREQYDKSLEDLIVKMGVREGDGEEGKVVTKVVTCVFSIK